MPRVPQAREGAVQETGLNIPAANVRVSQAATGGGREVAGTFTQAEKIFQEEKKKFDDIATLDANSKLVDLESSILNDPETGALNQRGKDSFSLSETVNENFDKQVGEIEKTLKTPEQQASFRRAVSARRANVNNRVRSHIARERVKYDNEVTEAFVQSESNAAALSWNDPNRVGQAVALQKAAIDDHGKRNGLPKEAIELRKTEVASNTHSKVVTNMLANGDTERAKKYFKGNKKDFTASDFATIEKDIQLASIRGDSQKATDQIIEKSTSMTEGLELARSIEDPKVRDETVRRVRQRFEEQRLAQRQQEESNYKSVSDLAKQVQTVDEIPPNKWNALSLEQQNRMANHMRNLRRGMVPPKNSATYYDQMTLASSNPQAFMQKNLLEDQDKIDEGQLSQLIKMQADMRQGKGLKGQDLKGFETKNQLLEGLLAEIDVNAKAKRGSDKEATLKFRQALDERVLQFEQDNKRRPNNNEIRQLGEELQVEVVTDRGFIFDTKKRIFELDPGDVPSVTFDDVPPEEVAKIKDAIQRRGVEPTDEQIVQLYATKLQRIRKRAGQ